MACTFPAFFLHCYALMTKHTKCFDNTFQSLVQLTMWMPQPDLPLILTRDSVNQNSQGVLDRVNRHLDFFALHIVQRGRGTHVIEGVAYAISRGDVYVMGQNTMHYYTQCDDLIVQNLFFSPALFDEPTRQALAEVPGIPSLIPGLLDGGSPANRAGRWLHLTPDAYERIEDELRELDMERSARLPGQALLVRGLFLRLLVHLARFQSEAHPVPQAAASAADLPPVTAALRFMEERYAEPLRIEQIASSVFLSSDRFTRIFVQAIGQTPRAYLRYLRIERAKALLRFTGLSMTVIASQAGFADPAYFTRAFHAATEMTPREYRRQSQAIP